MDNLPLSLAGSLEPGRKQRHYFHFPDGLGVVGRRQAGMLPATEEAQSSLLGLTVPAGSRARYEGCVQTHHRSRSPESCHLGCWILSGAAQSYRLLGHFHFLRTGGGSFQYIKNAGKKQVKCYTIFKIYLHLKN